LIENPLPWYDVVEEALFGLKLAWRVDINPWNYV
jgi:hypothetical protein